ADVVDLSNGCVALGELDERTHDVRYVAEAPRLVARAVDRDGLVLEGLTGERGQHHAVLPGLARSDRIEEADHGGGKAALLPVGDGEELVDELTRGIAPATLVRWTEDEVAVFSEWNMRGLPVDLGGARYQHTLSLLFGGAQHMLGAVNVGFDRAN